MRNSFGNERGNAAFYMIWLLGIVAILFLIVINISNIFVTGAQSSNTSEQAAIAGTSVILDETKKAINKFDDNPLSVPTRAHHNMKTIKEVIEDKKNTYQQTVFSEEQAYIKALNNVLPGEIEEHGLLKDTIKDHFNSVNLNDKIYAVVTSVVSDNQGNAADTQVVLSNTEWRLEVKTSVDYHSISDQQYIPEITDKIDGEGFGPSLEYLEKLY
ncbi:hypothetical protein [Virgibacillus sp. JSM 102003]|uniref:hypothetical protein n=1 Tax=Virgibacillus sp. JSM 102003 TaxID=1562108 RepID=UPI0035C17EAA